MRRAIISLAVSLLLTTAAHGACPTNSGSVLHFVGTNCSSNANPSGMCALGQNVTFSLETSPGVPYVMQPCETSVNWDFGDGTTLTTSGVTATHAFTSASSFFVHAMVMAGSTYINHDASYVSAANGLVYFVNPPDDVSETAGSGVLRVHTTFAPTTVDYTTIEALGSDTRYTPTHGTLTFAAGEYDKTITVQILNDSVYEGRGGVEAKLSNPTNGVVLGGTLDIWSGPRYPFTGEILIEDDEPPPAFDFGEAYPRTVSEADGTFTATVVRSGVTAAHAVDVTWNNDFTNGTLTFQPGDRQKSISIPIPHDQVWAPPRKHTIILYVPERNGVIPGAGMVGENWMKSGQWTVVDDQPSPVVTIGSVTMEEGNSGDHAMTFPVTLNGPLAVPLNVQIATHDGSAQAGSDYDALQMTLTFQPGEVQKSVDITIHGDPQPESDEWFEVNGTANSPYVSVSNGMGMIVNDDGTSMSVMAINPASASTAGGMHVTLSGQNFAPSCVVQFGGIPASEVTYDSPMSLSVTSPPHAAGPVEVTVTCNAQSLTVVNGFTYVVPARRRAVRP